MKYINIFLASSVEEFEVALEQFHLSGAPLIYTYFLELPAGEQAELAESCSSLGEILYELKEDGKAKKICREAIELYKSQALDNTSLRKQSGYHAEKGTHVNAPVIMEISKYQNP